MWLAAYRLRSLARMRWLALLLTAITVSSLGYSFAASNTLPASRGGDGSAGVGDYAVSNIRVQLDLDGDPSAISGMSFTLSGAGLPQPTAVRAQVLTPGGAPTGGWYTCAASGGTWSCSLLSGARARIVSISRGAPTMQLHVVATQ